MHQIGDGLAGDVELVPSLDPAVLGGTWVYRYGEADALVAGE